MMDDRGESFSLMAIVTGKKEFYTASYCMPKVLQEMGFNQCPTCASGQQVYILKYLSQTNMFEITTPWLCHPYKLLLTKPIVVWWLVIKFVHLDQSQPLEA